MLYWQYSKLHQDLLLYSAVILIAPVLFLVLLCHHNSWRMDQRFGLILLVWYFLIILTASLYE